MDIQEQRLDSPHRMRSDKRANNACTRSPTKSVRARVVGLLPVGTARAFSGSSCGSKLVSSKWRYRVSPTSTPEGAERKPLGIIYRLISRSTSPIPPSAFPPNAHLSRTNTNRHSSRRVCQDRDLAGAPHLYHRLKLDSAKRFARSPN